MNLMLVESNGDRSCQGLIEPSNAAYFAEQVNLSQLSDERKI